MIQRIIGRFTEQKMIESCLNSSKAEFVAVYGRRRVGKTFLMRQYFNDKFDFYITGVYQASLKEQLRNFAEQLSIQTSQYSPIPKNWHEAFGILKNYLSSLKKSKVVIFFDELPWLDTPRSGFIRELDYFWNSWGAQQTNLKFFVCGSATTWMTNNLIGAKGGLHNIRLNPFTLRETEAYLQAQRMAWDRYTITECYMIFGGIPYYLSLLRPDMSLSQNVDTLFFGPSGELKDEFGFVFQSLFNNSTLYRRIVELLSSKAKGLTREEIIAGLKLGKGGTLTEALQNLESCDFLRKYHAYGKKERGVLYQLIDNFSLFYLKFVGNVHGADPHAWSHMTDTPKLRSWRGYAFEQICLQHLPQVKKALGIDGILTTTSAWTGSDGDNKGQIDLVIDRNDRTINLCEMKFSQMAFEITKDYHRTLIERMELFRKLTKTTKSLTLIMISIYGIKQNMYSNAIQREIVADDLFR